MGLTISKTSAGNLAVDDGITKKYYNPNFIVGFRPNDRNEVVIELMSGGGNERYVKAHIADITSPAPTSIGNCTFDFTGGAEEDLWTKTAHGLSVGDSVLFSVVGTGAAGYEADTQYFVVSVPSVNTFQLSDELGGAVIEGTSDSAGTWTLVKWEAQDIVDKIEALFA